MEKDSETKLLQLRELYTGSQQAFGLSSALAMAPSIALCRSIGRHSSPHIDRDIYSAYKSVRRRDDLLLRSPAPARLRPPPLATPTGARTPVEILHLCSCIFLGFACVSYFIRRFHDIFHSLSYGIFRITTPISSNPQCISH